MGATVPLAVGCAIDVEGHKRRPPSKVGGLCHEFRFRVPFKGGGFGV